MKEKIDEEDEERKQLHNHTQKVSTYVNKRRKRRYFSLEKKNHILSASDRKQHM